jgi:uncharacterized protein (DUF1501 family)
MNRRDFIRRAVPSGALPFLIGGLSLRVYGRSPFLDVLTAAAVDTDRVFVLVQLNGGNDGLNMVIPLDQYSALSKARANILIDEAKVLRLSDVTGIHPSMSGLRSLYQGGKLSVIQSVGYPNPNQSHFRATDIWLTGADYDQVKPTGWMGRYLDEEFPDYPNGYPSPVMPDPLAIQIGSAVTPGLQGDTMTMGLAIADPNSTYVLPSNTDIAPDSPAGHELSFIRSVAQQTQTYSSAIKAAAAKVTNKSTLYGNNNSLSDQLKIVARLIAGGLKTRIYVVNYGGFDTHAGQVNGGAHESGTHATLLDRVSTAITAFLDDLSLLGADDRVLGMTFSEFGRRIASNASAGTDHGTAAPVFVFGKHVAPGILGTNPLIPANPTTNDNIPMQFDFRRIYWSILRDWFGAPLSEVTTVLSTPLYPGGQGLPIVSAPATAVAQDAPDLPREHALYQNYPNPFNPTTTISYDLPFGGSVRLDVFNTAGERVATLVEGMESAGRHEVPFQAGRLPSGAYFYRLQAGSFTATRKLLLVR